MSHASNLGQVDWESYDRVGAVDQVNWDVTSEGFDAEGDSDYFALRLLASIDVPESGAWTLSVQSDEAMALWIDGELVIDDSSPHSRRTQRATVTLDAGWHDFEICYLERRYSATLIASWQAPSASSETVIPASAFRRETLEAPDASGGLRAYWQDDTSHASNLGQVSWSDYDSTEIVDHVSWKIGSGAMRADGPSDYFAARFVGTIDVPESGVWTFKAGSDEGAQVFIDGSLVVNDPNPHSFRWSSGQISLGEGEHDIEVRYFERRYSSGLVVTWQGPDDPFEEVIPSNVLTPASVVEPGALAGGLRAYWSDQVQHASTLGQVGWDDFDVATVVPEVNWRISSGPMREDGPSDYFALRLLGHIDIPEAGLWQFSLGSDEGARLWIDGQLVVNDGDPHSFRWSSGSIELTPGEHTIEIHYFERRYSAGLVATWQGPSDAYESVIPSTALTPIDASDALAAGGLRAYWTTGVTHAAQLGHLDRLAYDHTSIVPDVNWPITSDALDADAGSDYFGLRLAGRIQIDEAGTWRFAVGSDEAARLWIDGEVVVDDSDPHSFRWNSGDIELTQGWHDFEIHYLERRYSAGLVATWRGPSDAHESVIPSAAFRPADIETPDEVSPRLVAMWTDGMTQAASLDHIDWERYDRTSRMGNVYIRPTNAGFDADCPTDYFAMRVVGRMVVPTGGTWTFGLGSDEAARLLIDGEVVADDPDPHSFRWAYGDVVLTEGEHEIDLRYLERRYSAGVVLTWAGGRDGVFQHVIPREAFLAPAAVPTSGGETAGVGLRARWYESIGRPIDVDDVDWSLVTETTRVGNASWRPTNGAFRNGGASDWFAVRLDGQITIPRTGEWTFGLGSDESAVLLIDGDPVVDDGSPHSFRWSEGSVILTEGVHTLEIQYLERRYSAGLFATWNGPGQPFREVIPPSAFVQRASGSRRRIVSWGEIGPDELGEIRRGVALRDRIGARRAGGMRIDRVVERLTELDGLDPDLDHVLEGTGSTIGGLLGGLGDD
ncbi:MAG: hypothetical protein H6811_03655 [Phycisphaeraceae bacterium]|nr:hypothetical protein [Phycisphaeraceae bacterium]